MLFKGTRMFTTLQRKVKGNRSIVTLGLLAFILAGIYTYLQAASSSIFSFNSQPSSSVRKVSHGSVPEAARWVVVTSIQAPTPQVKKLASLPGWKLIVVGDKKTPPPEDWKLPGVVYLSPADQEVLGYSVLKYIPYNSYCRKIIGYLYAIQHGARSIYDTDDDNSPYNDLSGFDVPNRFTVNTNKALAYNPCAHFGQSSIWPRGYPLGMIGIDAPHSYAICDQKANPTNSTRYPKVMVKQGLVNGDPDVDAIFRLTRKHVDVKNINLTFDVSAPAVTVPLGTFTPYNSQNTVFEYEALWALVLPRSVTMRVCDIWRAYWSQPLMWLVGGRLAYYPPHTVQVRNGHSYVKDAVDEYDLYGKTLALLEFLSRWKCQRDDLTSLPQCAMQLTRDMAEHDFWGHDDVTLIHAWLQDLIDIGYKFPALLPDIADTPGEDQGCSGKPPRLVTCYAKEQYTIRHHSPDLVPLENKARNKLHRKPLCSDL